MKADERISVIEDGMSQMRTNIDLLTSLASLMAKDVAEVEKELEQIQEDIKDMLIYMQEGKDAGK